MLRRVLFKGKDVSVVSVGLPVSGPTYVTFSSVTSGGVKDGAWTGFGEKFFHDAQIPCLHYINHRNHWWQTTEMEDALDAGLAAIEGSSRRIGYGSSMGGYGIIRFSEPLKLDTLLAFAPQYSVAPAITPWEQRWPVARARLTFSPTERPMRKGCECCIFYDPNSPDMPHIDLFDSDIAFHKIIMHGPGHYVLKAFARTGALRELLTGVLDDEIAPHQIAGFVEKRMAEFALRTQTAGDDPIDQPFLDLPQQG